MTTAWDAAVRNSLAARAARLHADAKPAWGKLNVSGMLAHLNDSYRMALGDLEVKAVHLPLRYPPLRQMVIYWMPIPKSAPTAPELIRRADHAVLAEEQQVFPQLLHRVGAAVPGSLVPHPAFGNMSHAEWGVLIAKHTDHHLRQFGA